MKRKQFIKQSGALLATFTVLEVLQTRVLATVDSECDNSTPENPISDPDQTCATYTGSNYERDQTCGTAIPYTGEVYHPASGTMTPVYMSHDPDEACGAPASGGGTDIDQNANRSWNIPGFIDPDGPGVIQFQG
jgi:hypothetical protein